jgi:AcrR family transcriptional regulator
VTTALPRREQLLEAAAHLFADRGFHAVGIDDIGSAAGISGPGVYRHFPSKAALLESLCDRAMTRMLDGARSIVASAGSPDEALEQLVELHAAFGVQERALIGVWVREARALSDDVRRSLRRRMRAYEQLWHGVLAPLRDDLDAVEVALVVGSTLAMLNGTAFTTPSVGADRLELLLRRMALAALLSRKVPAQARRAGAGS